MNRCYNPILWLFHLHREDFGNGTASRESEALAADVIRKCPGVNYVIVSEAGASVYSASPLAKEEFPEYDLSLRSAVFPRRQCE